MHEQIQWLYRSARGFTDYEGYREELLIQCEELERRVMEILDTLPEQDRASIEGYFLARDELEFQTVRLAYLNGKKIGKSESGES